VYRTGQGRFPVGHELESDVVQKDVHESQRQTPCCPEMTQQASPIKSLSDIKKKAEQYLWPFKASGMWFTTLWICSIAEWRLRNPNLWFGKTSLNVSISRSVLSTIRSTILENVDKRLIGLQDSGENGSLPFLGTIVTRPRSQGRAAQWQS